MKHSLSCKVCLRRVLGVVAIVGVVAIPAGWEFSFVNRAKAEDHRTSTFDEKNH